ncbi:hypothetical protein ATANTOWER_002612 [Ataeniobius toweri]|uniref:Small EDRK-rich factor-like N-terminal domain-containing protein n=1 Tax=Ataeniobius toweri TaxID=208326 RepID=A0ABU7B561_9TELE|nr:hypothetical protein [Ataeniobius toweri]
MGSNSAASVRGKEGRTQGKKEEGAQGTKEERQQKEHKKVAKGQRYLDGSKLKMVMRGHCDSQLRKP